MTRLILLNGPLGSGKSTLAKNYAELKPMTLNLDIDKVWFMISGWRENWEESASLAKEMGLAIAKIHLEARHDVIVPQVILNANLLERFESLAKQTNSKFCHILINLDKDEALDRYRTRNQQKDKPDGYVPETKHTEEEIEAKFLERFERMNEVVKTRTNIQKILTSQGDIDGAVSQIARLTE